MSPEDEDYSLAVVGNFLRSLHGDDEDDLDVEPVSDPYKPRVDAPRRLATFCGAEHPLLPELLCGRLSGHGGTHAADEDTAWDDTWNCVTTNEEKTA